jgi:hypothetical protein
MKSMTISEGFRDAIGERRVERAFFSTYCLEPDFFELEVLPLMLGSPALSTAESIRYHQLQSLMGASRGRFGVAYEASVFMPILAPRLEVDYLPLLVDGACHHAKLAVIEVADKDGKHAVVLCAGSFNLTKAGWWENIEVGHWVELSATDAPANILKPLRRAIDYYLTQGELPVLQALRELLSTWRPGPDHESCSFYFSGLGSPSFTSFLKPVTQGILEVVSPYFAEDSNNARVTRFLNGFDEVSILLPRDSDQAATVTEDFHAGLSDHVLWCDWHPTVEKEFKLPTASSAEDRGYRKLHAKIYAGDDWQFIGSVNLSYKAMFANVEAGFLLTGVGRRRLLGNEAQATHFAGALAVEAPCPDAGAVPFPAVFLVFDWNTGRLEASCQRYGTLVLHDKEGVESLRLPLHGEPVQVPADALREHLRHSSLVRARWHQDGESSAPHDVLVSQRHVYCRPSMLPPMSLQELLRILQSMHPAHRAAAYARLAARAPRLTPDDIDSLEFLPPKPANGPASTFFAEFSQVNAAFWQLKQRLAAHPAEVAYYLDGEQPDSLRGIIRAMSDTAPNAASTPVVRYLTLLSMNEALGLHGRSGSTLADSVRQLIALEENSPAFNAIDDKEKFLGWIKRTFALPVSSTANTHAET